MNRREELEGALANAKGDLAKAAANLAKAYAGPTETEADLPKVFSSLARAKADVAKAEADLAKARASCFTLHTALARPNIADGRLSAYDFESRRMAQEAAPEKAHTNRRKANDNRRFISHFSAQEPSPSDALAGLSILRPTIGLVSLVLAYLLYFHIDVQLQILKLPSIFPGPLS